MSRVIREPYPKFRQLGGVTGQFLRLVDPDVPSWSAFNPSIAYSPEFGYAATIRSSNYTIEEATGAIDVRIGNLVKSEVWYATFDDKFELQTRVKVQFDKSGPSLSRGVEDARLLWRDGSWYFTAIMLEKEHTPYARVVMYKYDPVANLATFIKKWDGPDVFRPEKNWMTTPEVNPNFDFIYGATGVIKDDCLIGKPSTNKALGGLRGNTNLHPLGDGTYLALMHSLYLKGGTVFSQRTMSMQKASYRKYTHQFVRFDNYGNVIELSDEFVFDDLDIEFAAGIVEKDGKYVISYGRKDTSSHLAIIDKQRVNDMLIPVDEIYVPMIMPTIL